MKTENPADIFYKFLRAELKPMDHESREFKIICKSVKETHGPTHNKFAIRVDDIFAVYKPSEQMRYFPFRRLHNKRLLWHGSRITNYMGILVNVRII